MRNKKAAAMILTALALTAAAVGCTIRKRKKEDEPDDGILGCDGCCFGFGKHGVSDSDNDTAC